MSILSGNQFLCPVAAKCPHFLCLVHCVCVLGLLCSWWKDSRWAETYARSHKVHNFRNIFVDRFLNTGKSSFRWHFYVQAGELAEGWLKRGGPLLSPFLMGRCYRGLVKDIKRWVADGGKLPSTKTSPTDLKPQHRSFQGQFKLISSNQGLYTRPLAVGPQILASREYTHLAHLFHLILVTTPYIFACCHPFTSFACSLDRVEIKAAAAADWTEFRF